VYLPWIKVYYPAVAGSAEAAPSHYLTEEAGELIEVDQKEETMKRIRLKYAITEFGETLYEVGLKVSHDVETSNVKHAHKSSGKASETTEAQMAQRQCFKLSIAYLRAVLANPEVRAHYEEMARQQGKRLRDVAVSDYLRGNDLLAKK
jgi:hypothetical protein